MVLGNGQQNTKISVKPQTVVEIPESFEWVVNYWLKWREESRTGQFILDFKDGGIKGIKEIICISPKKHLTNSKN